MSSGVPTNLSDSCPVRWICNPTPAKLYKPIIHIALCMFSFRNRLSNFFGTSDAELSVEQQRHLERPRFSRDSGMDAETLASMLSNKRRNLAFAAVFREKRIELDHLAEVVALSENMNGHETELHLPGGKQLSELEPDEGQVKNTRDSLRRSHIPRLTDRGIVAWETDERDGEEVEYLTPGENGEAAYKALRELERFCTPRGYPGEE